MIVLAKLVFKYCTYAKTNLNSCVCFGFYSLDIIPLENKSKKEQHQANKFHVKALWIPQPQDIF